MQKNKLIREWLQQLPEPYREKALANFALEKERQDSTASSIALALAGAFSWGMTVEGYEYWAELQRTLFNNEDNFSK